MQKVSKKLKDFISSISVVGDSTIPDDDGKIYYSKIDGSYITRVGLEKDLGSLLKFGITEGIQNTDNKPHTANIGFNPIERKWYGWSHRAIFGFGVGSKCTKGSCGYSASNKSEFQEQQLRWYGDTDMEDTYKVKATVREHTQDWEQGVLVEYEYNDKIPNVLMRGVKKSVFEPYPKSFGKGEWEAKTLEDAKQMAIDFAKSV